MDPMGFSSMWQPVAPETVVLPEAGSAWGQGCTGASPGSGQMDEHHQGSGSVAFGRKLGKTRTAGLWAGRLSPAGQRCWGNASRGLLPRECLV